MIETIVKRNGEEEPFQPKKVNGWGIWAAEVLGDHVDWASGVMAAVGTLPAKTTSQDLQDALIRHFLNQGTWANNRMAGRLYGASLHKILYGDQFPTIQELHKRLCEVGYMRPLDYSDAEYAHLNTIINHKRDFDYAHTQIDQIRYKYALRNHLTKEEYESCQFVFMRMAMALGETQPQDRRIEDVTYWYEFFSKNKINCPTPNYTNLGTKLNGYASCCLINVDDNANSLGVGDHIAYMMTVMSAGIGTNIQTRSIKDPVRNGMFAHRGKIPYYRALHGAIQANIKNGRNGACNVFFSAFDPENRDILRLKNPMTPADKQLRGLDYAMLTNKFLGRKAARKEDVFLFNVFTAPDLTEAFYSGDLDRFVELYEKYEQDPSFEKKYVSAREVLLHSRNEAYETGRAYWADIGEINRHTPFKDPIYSSNLCMEITEPTSAYNDMKDLYSNEAVGRVRLKAKGEEIPFAFGAVDKIMRVGGISDAAQNLKAGDRFYFNGNEEVEVEKILDLKKEPEVALCSLAGVVLPNIESDEEYEKVMYYALLMIDKCIHMSDYVLPHVGYTAKNRMNAGIGIMSLAHYLAKKGLKYSTLEGKQEIHRVAERHMYFAIKGSLKLGQELGNAPWIHRTKWAEGWIPLDTYNTNIDKVVDNVENQYDWAQLKADLIKNGGIRNSALVAYMPGESSSKASGGFNSIYPARDLSLIKTDGNAKVYWTAPDSDTLLDQYELAWDIPIKDQIEVYGVVQKWTDMTISADLFQRLLSDSKVSSDDMLQHVFTMYRVGMKTQYYTNTKVSKEVKLDREVEIDTSTLNNETIVTLSNNDSDNVVSFDEESVVGCESGACSL